MNYRDLAALNDVKAFIMNLSGDRLRDEAEVVYNLEYNDYENEQELRSAMIAREERNYWK